jgi:hypothetical protein
MLFYSIGEPLLRGGHSSPNTLQRDDLRLISPARDVSQLILEQKTVKEDESTSSFPIIRILCGESAIGER